MVRELESLGYEAKITRPGRIEFAGDHAALCRANLWLRSADRVLIQLAKFPCPDFDALFDTTREIDWETWIDRHASIPVRGRSHKSQLSSVPACQRAVKKAIVERLRHAYANATLPETGPPVAVEIALLDDEATVSIDTTGDGLHRRGYRTLTAEAQLRETLAAALVQLSFWKADRPLVDPFCGTGTILIEAVMIARRLAPGRNRSFAAEQWPAVPEMAWQTAREEARDLVLPTLEERPIGTDIDPAALKLARYHAAQAGVEEDIHFQQRSFADLQSSRQYGCTIMNPPYGMRMGHDEEIEELYRTMPEVLRRLDTWSHFVFSARDDFEKLVGQQADRRRKLYNGQIACTYFQFYGPKRPRRRPREEEANVERQQAPQTPAKPAPAFGGLKAEAARQAEEFANRLRKRARHLRRWPTKRGITCYRLYERDIPEVPLVVDRYEDALHIAEFERPHDRTAAEHADWLDHLMKTAAAALEVAEDEVYLKHRARQRGAAQYTRIAESGHTKVVQEAGLKFLVNLADYLDTGLFLDHRNTRAMVRDEANGKRFLNLFGYTGSFTVYAAAGGASHTTTVDQSASYLAWAKENLQLNGFAGDNHRMCAADIRAFLSGLKSSEQYDLVVIDPPTFSNRKGVEHDWDVQRDHADTLNQLLRHVSDAGVVYFSTNSRRFKLEEQKIKGVTIREISRHTVPEDFRNKRIHRCWRLVKGA